MTIDDKPFADTTLGELMDPRNLKDPTFWSCCLFPVGIALFVLVGMLYKFTCWAYF